MFKQIITDVIGKELKTYVQGFDSDSFGLDLRGNVRLKNLRIKADALSELQLIEDEFNLRMRKATGQLNQSHLLGKVKRDIARVKTVLNEKAGQ